MLIKEVIMEDCKYRLPCGRCDKFNKDCDMPKKCEHEWDAVSFEMTNNGLLYHFKCNKCNEIKVVPMIMDT